MSDALPQNETENQTDSQTGDDLKTIGQAGLSHPRAPFTAVKVLIIILLLSVFGFASFGFGETPYTTRHWLTTIVTGGGLLPKVFSRDFSVALRAATDTMLGEVEMNKSDYAEAEKYFSRALVAYQVINAEQTFCGHSCLVGLAKALSEQKKDEKAKDILNRSLQVAESLYGKDHEVVAGNLRELAFGATRQKNYAAAESLYERALALDTKGLGTAHFDVAYDMSCVGEMAYLQKDYDKAIKYLSDSLVIYKQARGEYHPSFFWVEESLAKAYYESSSYAQAARQFESVLTRSDRLHGTPGKDYLRDLAWLSWSYYYDNNKERAVLRAKKLKDFLDKKSDLELSSMSDVLESAGDVLMFLGEYRPAIAMFERYVKVQDPADAGYDGKARKVVVYIAECYERSGQTEEAKRYREASGEESPNYKVLLQH